MNAKKTIGIIFSAVLLTSAVAGAAKYKAEPQKAKKEYKADKQKAKKEFKADKQGSAKKFAPALKSW